MIRFPDGARSPTVSAPVASFAVAFCALEFKVPSAAGAGWAAHSASPAQRMKEQRIRHVSMGGLFLGFDHLRDAIEFSWPEAHVAPGPDIEGAFGGHGTVAA